MVDDWAVAGRFKPGCLVIAVVFVALLVLLGTPSVGALLEVWSHETEPTAQTSQNAAWVGPTVQRRPPEDGLRR